VKINNNNDNNVCIGDDDNAVMKTDDHDDPIDNVSNDNSKITSDLLPF
jgi:hypothetical protein